MPQMPWRGAINQILYALIYSDRLDDNEVTRMADTMIERRFLVAGPQTYLDAIKAGLASGEQLGGGIRAPHSDEEFRDLLIRLAEHLEHSRPWPEPKLARLNINEWRMFAHAQPIAIIDKTSHTVGQAIPGQFDPLPSGDGEGPQGMVLKLRSGAVIGLLAPADFNAPGVRVLLREGDPTTAMRELLEFTHIPADAVRRIE